jgi:hypothetical protein
MLVSPLPLKSCALTVSKHLNHVKVAPVTHTQSQRLGFSVIKQKALER